MANEKHYNWTGGSDDSGKKPGGGTGWSDGSVGTGGNNQEPVYQYEAPGESHHEEPSYQAPVDEAPIEQAPRVTGAHYSPTWFVEEQQNRKNPEYVTEAPEDWNNDFIDVVANTVSERQKTHPEAWENGDPGWDQEDPIWQKISSYEDDYQIAQQKAQAMQAEPAPTAPTNGQQVTPQQAQERPQDMYQPKSIYQKMEDVKSRHPEYQQLTVDTSEADYNALSRSGKVNHWLFPSSAGTDVENVPFMAKITQGMLSAGLSSTGLTAAVKLLGTAAGVASGPLGWIAAGAFLGTFGYNYGKQKGWFKGNKYIDKVLDFTDFLDPVSQKLQGRLAYNVYKATGGDITDHKDFWKEFEYIITHPISVWQNTYLNEYDSDVVDVVLSNSANIRASLIGGQQDISRVARNVLSSVLDENKIHLDPNEVTRNNLGLEGEYEIEHYGAEAFDYWLKYLQLIKDEEGADKSELEYALGYDTTQYLGDTANYSEILEHELGDLGNVAEGMQARGIDVYANITHDPNLRQAAQAHTGTVLGDTVGGIPVVGKIVDAISKASGKDSKFSHIFEQSGGIDEIIDTWDMTNKSNPVDQLTARDRRFSGITDDNKVRGYDPIKNPNTVKNPFVKGAIAIKNLFSTTNEYRAVSMGEEIFNFISVGVEDALRSHGNEDTSTTVDRMNRFLDELEHPETIQEGTPFYKTSQSAMFNTVKDDLAQAVHNNREKISKSILRYQNLANNRKTLNILAEALGLKPSEIIDMYETKKTVLTQMILNKADKSGGKIPGIVDNEGKEIDVYGREFGDKVIQMLKPFTGKDAEAFDVRQLTVQMTSDIADGVTDTIINKYQIEPDPLLYRFGDMIKKLQNLVLLGLSPSYLANNFTNNIVTRSALGYGGYLSGRMINNWMDRFGFIPERFKESMAGEIGQESQNTDSNYEKLNARIKAEKQKVKGSGFQKTAANAMRKVGDAGTWASKTFGIFGNLSNKVEANESRQIIASAMMRYMARTWKPGVNFRKMPRQLEVAINAQNPGMVDTIYAAISNGLNMAEIEDAIFGTYIAPSVKDTLLQAAESVGLENAEDFVTEYFVGNGMFDQLNVALRGKRMEDVDKIIDDFSKQLKSMLQVQLSQDLANRAQSVSVNVTNAGYTEALSVANDDADALFEIWFESQQMNSQLFNRRIRENMSTQEFREAYRKQSEFLNERWKNVYATSEQNWLGILNGLGFKDKHAKDFLKFMHERNQVWVKFYNKTKPEAFNKYLAALVYRPDDPNKEAWDARAQQAWSEYTQTMNNAYEQAYRQESQKQKLMDDALVAAFRASLGKTKATEFASKIIPMMNELRAKRDEVVQQYMEVRAEADTSNAYNAKNNAWNEANNKLVQLKTDYLNKQQELYKAISDFGPFGSTEEATPATAPADPETDVRVSIAQDKAEAKQEVYKEFNDTMTARALDKDANIDPDLGTGIPAVQAKAENAVNELDSKVTELANEIAEKRKASEGDLAKAQNELAKMRKNIEDELAKVRQELSLAIGNKDPKYQTLKSNEKSLLKRLAILDGKPESEIDQDSAVTDATTPEDWAMEVRKGTLRKIAKLAGYSSQEAYYYAKLYEARARRWEADHPGMDFFKTFPRIIRKIHKERFTSGEGGLYQIDWSVYDSWDNAPVDSLEYYMKQAYDNIPPDVKQTDRAIHEAVENGRNQYFSSKLAQVWLRETRINHSASGQVLHNTIFSEFQKKVSDKLYSKLIKPGIGEIKFSQLSKIAQKEINSLALDFDESKIKIEAFTGLRDYYEFHADNLYEIALRAGHSEKTSVAFATYMLLVAKKWNSNNPGKDFFTDGMGHGTDDKLLKIFFFNDYYSENGKVSETIRGEYNEGRIDIYKPSSFTTISHELFHGMEYILSEEQARKIADYFGISYEEYIRLRDGYVSKTLSKEDENKAVDIAEILARGYVDYLSKTKNYPSELQDIFVEFNHFAHNLYKTGRAYVVDGASTIFHPHSSEYVSGIVDSGVPSPFSSTEITLDDIMLLLTNNDPNEVEAAKQEALELQRRNNSRVQQNALYQTEQVTQPTDVSSIIAQALKNTDMVIHEKDFKIDGNYIKDASKAINRAKRILSKAFPEFTDFKDITDIKNKIPKLLKNYITTANELRISEEKAMEQLDAIAEKGRMAKKPRGGNQERKISMQEDAWHIKYNVMKAYALESVAQILVAEKDNIYNGEITATTEAIAETPTAEVAPADVQATEAQTTEAVKETAESTTPETTATAPAESVGSVSEVITNALTATNKVTRETNFQVTADIIKNASKVIENTKKTISKAFPEFTDFKDVDKTGKKIPRLLEKYINAAKELGIGEKEAIEQIDQLAGLRDKDPKGGHNKEKRAELRSDAWYLKYNLMKAYAMESVANVLADEKDNIYASVTEETQTTTQVTDTAPINTQGMTDFGKAYAESITPEERQKILTKKATKAESDTQTRRTQRRAEDEIPNGRLIKGQFKVEDGTGIVDLFLGSDFSTLIHESMGHGFILTLDDYQVEALAAYNGWTLKRYRELENQWYFAPDTMSAEDRQAWIDSQERFAYGFEQWLLEGKAPNSALESVFKAFRKFLLEVYRGVRQVVYKGEPIDIHNLQHGVSLVQIFESMFIEEEGQTQFDIDRTGLQGEVTTSAVLPEQPVTEAPAVETPVASAPATGGDNADKFVNDHNRQFFVADLAKQKQKMEALRAQAEAKLQNDIANYIAGIEKKYNLTTEESVEFVIEITHTLGMNSDRNENASLKQSIDEKMGVKGKRRSEVRKFANAHREDAVKISDEAIMKYMQDIADDPANFPQYKMLYAYFQEDQTDPDRLEAHRQKATMDFNDGLFAPLHHIDLTKIQGSQKKDAAVRQLAKRIMNQEMKDPRFLAKNGPEHLTLDDYIAYIYASVDEKGNPVIDNMTKLRAIDRIEHYDKDYSVRNAISALRQNMRKVQKPPKSGDYIIQTYVFKHGPLDIVAAVYHDGSLVAYVPKGLPKTEITIGEDGDKAQILGVSIGNPNLYVYEYNGEIKTTKQMEGPGTNPVKPEMKSQDMPVLDPTGQAHNEVAYKGVFDTLEEFRRLYKQKLNNAEQDQKFSSLDDDTKSDLRGYINQDVRNDLMNTKYKSTKFGEMMRDAALLNYSKRYGFDNFMTLLFPYQFWNTRSMLRWMSRLSSKGGKMWRRYARLKELERRNRREFMPSKTSGQFGLYVPGLPEWMGDSIFMPTDQLTVVGNFMEPLFDQIKENNAVIATAERFLQEDLDDRKITFPEWQMAMNPETREESPVWQEVLARAQVAEGSDGSFTNLFKQFFGFSLPVSIGKALASGNPADWNQWPVTRLGTAFRATVGGDFGKMGEWVLSAPEKALRNAASERFGSQFAYNEFGAFGDYYMRNMVFDMVTEGRISAKDAVQACIEKDGNPIYEEAAERMREEVLVKMQGGAVIDASKKLIKDLRDDTGDVSDDVKYLFAALLTAPQNKQVVHAAERDWREKKGELAETYENNDREARQQFFEDNPEMTYVNLRYESDPETMLRQYLYKTIMDKWYELDRADQEQIRMSFDDDFQNYVLNSETRAIDAMDLNKLAGYAQALNGKVPYLATDKLNTMNVPQIPIMEIPPVEKNAYLQYLEERERDWKGWADINNMYWNMNPKDREAFKKANPKLDMYQKWNSDYKETHPDAAKFMKRQTEYRNVRDAEHVCAMLDRTTMTALTYSAMSGKSLDEKIFGPTIRKAMRDSGVTKDYDQFVKILQKFIMGQ